MGERLQLHDVPGWVGVAMGDGKLLMVVMVVCFTLMAAHT
jgi:hypothetical protein